MTDENDNQDNTSEEENPKPDPKEEDGAGDDGDKGEEDKDQEDEENEEEEKPIDPEKITITTRRSEEEGEDGDDEDDGIDPDDKKTIGKIVDKRVGKLDKRIQDQQDEIDVNTFVLEKPEMSKYKPVILKYMKHPAYSNIPVKNIASMVASEDLQKLGAKKERIAQKNADDTKDGGRQKRSKDMGKTDWMTAPKEAFEKKIAQVKGMQL